ncbi:hypothetical protein T492DRAFT_850617 [Pavlovales sp. CCMP2436]|nr:hypothetical protein T492DRAFT_850617 [Pavlovales sp. CCMP2436]
MFGSVAKKKSMFGSVGAKSKFETVAKKNMSDAMGSVSYMADMASVVKPEMGAVSKVARGIKNKIQESEIDFSQKFQMGAPAEYNKLSLYPRTGNVNTYGGQIVEFVVPSSSKGNYFQSENSYSQFRINNTSAAPFIIDSSAMSLILKYEVFFGGQRLSSAPEAGMFGAILLDHTVSADDRSTGWNAAGTIIPSYSTGTPTVASLQSDASSGGYLDVAIPISSGILSPQGLEKNIPMSQLRDDLLVSITIAGVSRWGRIGSGTLTPANADVQLYINKTIYQVSMLKLDGRVDESIYKSLTNQTFTIPCTDMRHYSQNIPAGTGAIVNIPARFKSVKQLFCVFTRLGSNSTVHTVVPSNATTYALNTPEVTPINSSGMNGSSSTFINGDGYLNNVGQMVNGITGWRLRVGGLNYGIVSDACSEARFELMKCFHKLNAADMSSSVTQKQFMEESYVIGMSLEAYGADKIFYDGLERSNSGSVQLEIDGSFPNCTANVFLVYDKVITISDGLISYKE